MFLFASARRSGDVDGLEKNKSWPISVSGARFLTYFLNFLSVKYSDSSRARVDVESSPYDAYCMCYVLCAQYN